MNRWIAGLAIAVLVVAAYVWAGGGGCVNRNETIYLLTVWNQGNSRFLGGEFTDERTTRRLPAIWPDDPVELALVTSGGKKCALRLFRERGDTVLCEIGIVPGAWDLSPRDLVIVADDSVRALSPIRGARLRDSLSATFRPRRMDPRWIGRPEPRP